MSTKVTRRSKIPGPTNIELLNILQERIEQDKRPSFITDMQNLYEKEPWLLQHVRHVSFVENLWFYFVTRKHPPRIRKTDSKRPSRKVVGSGRWKTTSTWNEITNKDGVRVGSMKTISFKANSETVKDGITTGWVMHEFVLDKPGFQELALCRIRFYKRKDNAQYSPRLAPIVIGLEQKDDLKLVENNHSQNHMTIVVTCSGEVVAKVVLQRQNIMGQDSKYPILNGGDIEQHQSLGSCGKFLGESSGQQQQQNKILRQATHNVPCSAQPYDQYKGQNNEFPTVPVKTQQHQNSELSTVPIKTEQQQEDNIVTNSAAQLHIEALVDDIPWLNQTMEAEATDLPTDTEWDKDFPGGVLFKDMDSEMDNCSNKFCVGDWAKRFTYSR